MHSCLSHQALGRELSGEYPLPSAYHTSAQLELPPVGIVVLNYNNYDDTRDCLESLSRLQYGGGFFVILVDNGSTDGSGDRLATDFPIHTALHLTKNRGFAGGNNAGIRLALHRGAKYIWLVNNDAVVRPDALTVLVRMAERHGDVGFFGSVIVYYSDRERVWFGGGGFGRRSGRIWNEGFEKTASSEMSMGPERKTSWVTGCSLLVRAATVREIGLLDESYFLYREELEWQLRANPGKPEAYLSTEPIVAHKVGRTTGSSQSSLGVAFMSRNFLKLANDHAGAALPIWLVRWWVEYITIPILRGKPCMIRDAVGALMFIGEPGEKLFKAVTDDCHERDRNP